LPMPTYPCARCQRPLGVDDALAGRRVQCPHCGNVEVAPAVARPAVGGLSRGAVEPAPTDDQPERELARVHPATLRARPVSAACLLLAASAGIGLAAAAVAAPQRIPRPDVAMWAGGVVALGTGVWLAAWKVRSLATTLVITTRRTIVRRGLFSR